VGGGAWQLHPAGLQYGEAFLQVGFSRGGLSSILFLLIAHFAACEWALKNEARKFFFMVHFPLYFIIAYICFYTLSGWIMVLGNDAMGAAFAWAEGWIPLLCFILLVVAVLRLSGRSDRLNG
jgi:cytosine/uracil/thiamine/allantoin permease